MREVSLNGMEKKPTPQQQQQQKIKLNHTYAVHDSLEAQN